MPGKTAFLEMLIMVLHHTTLKGDSIFWCLQAYVKAYVVFMRISNLLGPLMFKEVRNQEPKNFLLKEYLDSSIWAGTLIPASLCRN